MGWQDYDENKELVCLFYWDGHGASFVRNYSYLCTSQENKGRLGGGSSELSKLAPPQVLHLNSTSLIKGRGVPLNA